MVGLGVGLGLGLGLVRSRTALSRTHVISVCLARSGRVASKSRGLSGSPTSPCDRPRAVQSRFACHSTRSY